MNPAHLKKQAKNLKKLLPDFLKDHANKPPLLADFQELIARVHGYPSWHAASSQDRIGADTTRPTTDLLNIEVIIDQRDFFDLKKDGHHDIGKELPSAIFQSKNARNLEAITERFDALLDEIGYAEEFDEDGPPPQYCMRLIKACQEFVGAEPSFIDGYAHLVSAFFRLGKHTEALEIGTPIYAALVSLLPKKFRGRINYYEHENRPFHRLAYNLSLANYDLATQEGNKAGDSIANQMLKWWPNDNAGFRFFLNTH